MTVTINLATPRGRGAIATLILDGNGAFELLNVFFRRPDGKKFSDLFSVSCCGSNIDSAFGTTLELPDFLLNRPWFGHFLISISSQSRQYDQGSSCGSDKSFDFPSDSSFDKNERNILSNHLSKDTSEKIIQEEVIIHLLSANRVEIHSHGGLQVVEEIERMLLSRGAVSGTIQNPFFSPLQKEKNAAQEINVVQTDTVQISADSLDAVQLEALRLLSVCPTRRCAKYLLDQYGGALSNAVHPILNAVEQERNHLSENSFYLEQKKTASENSASVNFSAENCSQSQSEYQVKKRRSPNFCESSAMKEEKKFESWVFCQRQVQRLLKSARIGLHLTSPFRVVLLGAPNSGKSSLLNRLLGYERAIVDATAGTTRDVVSVQTVFDGWPILLTDTAGLRDTEFSLEEQGIQKALSEWERADLVLWVQDIQNGKNENGKNRADESQKFSFLSKVMSENYFLSDTVLKNETGFWSKNTCLSALMLAKPILRVRSKVDLVSIFNNDQDFLSNQNFSISQGLLSVQDSADRDDLMPVFDVSAKTGYGIEALQQGICRALTETVMLEQAELKGQTKISKKAPEQSMLLEQPKMSELSELPEKMPMPFTLRQVQLLYQTEECLTALIRCEKDASEKNTLENDIFCGFDGHSDSLPDVDFDVKKREMLTRISFLLQDLLFEKNKRGG